MQFSTERRGLLIADPEHPSLDRVPDSSLDHLQAASVSYRIAIGPQAGRKALTLYSVAPVEEAPNHPLLARRAGFSLHAATVCEAWQRSRLERLCRYITRPDELDAASQAGLRHRHRDLSRLRCNSASHRLYRGPTADREDSGPCATA